LALYGKERAESASETLHYLREVGDEGEVKRFLEPYIYRMHDLSHFLKLLRQRFTQPFNRRNNRRGRLWEGIVKSLLVQGESEAISMMAAYIDLNPVRAGIVDDPATYPFCGFGEASLGCKDAKKGIKQICEILGHKGDWRSESALYKEQMFLDEEKDRNIQVALAEGDKLSKAELLRCRLRYLTDGLAFGDRTFIDELFQSNRGMFGEQRKSGARRPRFGDWGNMFTMRALCREPIMFYAPKDAMFLNAEN
jgi:hypothetical protein